MVEASKTKDSVSQNETAAQSGVFSLTIQIVGGKVIDAKPATIGDLRVSISADKAQWSECAYCGKPIVYVADDVYGRGQYCSDSCLDAETDSEVRDGLASEGITRGSRRHEKQDQAEAERAAAREVVNDGGGEEVRPEAVVKLRERLAEAEREENEVALNAALWHVAECLKKSDTIESIAIPKGGKVVTLYKSGAVARRPPRKPFAPAQTEAATDAAPEIPVDLLTPQEIAKMRATLDSEHRLTPIHPIRAEWNVFRIVKTLEAMQAQIQAEGNKAAQ